MTRILIVEDEGLIALYAESVLVAAGHEVVGIAHTVADAIALTLSERPDLVLMDIHLRAGESGVVAAKELRGKTRIVFSTAENAPERLPGVQEAEPVGYLKKPYGKADLLRVVANFGGSAAPPKNDL